MKKWFKSIGKEKRTSIGIHMVYQNALKNKLVEMKLKETGGLENKD